MTNKQIINFNNFIPSGLKKDNPVITGLVSNLFNGFMSEENSVNVNGRIGKQNDEDPKLIDASLERQVNAITPAIYYKTGTEENIATFNNLVNKMNALNIDVVNMRKWIAEQPFSFALPINYDKFINYANYFWVGNAIKKTPSISWNPTVDPEYYVIARPKDTDLRKMPVDLASTGNLVLYSAGRKPEEFTISFTSNSTFTINSDIGPVISNTYSLVTTDEGDRTEIRLSSLDSLSGNNDPDNLPDDLCSFYITNGAAPFLVGDKIKIKITYFTSQIYISLISNDLTDKGFASGVNTTAKMMYVDGVQLTGGERILVKNQLDARENGIYSVNISSKWERTSDADLDNKLVSGSTIFVENGALYGGKSFKLTSKIPQVSVNNELTSTMLFSGLGAVEKQVNNWQEFNYWYHKDDLDSSINQDLMIQAQAPIIEYSSELELNDFINNETNLSGLTFTQFKTRFNQLPQFNLFRYDGTKFEQTSSIFFYVEDPDYPVDAFIKRRTKTTDNQDYVFGTGLKDNSDRTLYFKINGELKSCWQPGESSTTLTPILFSGLSGKGTLSISNISATADIQDWELISLSATNFSINGSRSGLIGEIQIGTPFTYEEMTFNISQGINDFVAGEKFTFSVFGKLSPRYVKSQPDNSFINYPGGPSGDLTDSVIDGAWAAPLRMFQNLERETRDEIGYGDLMEHFRSVIRNQDNFIGTSFGTNNSRLIDINPGRGGMIREFDSNFPLLVSMLLEKDVSPLTMLDFAEQQYLTALSSIDQFISDELVTYLSSADSVVLNNIDPQNAQIIKMAEHFENLRKLNYNLRNVYHDTTADVSLWPVTLPMMGISPKFYPTIKFDNELGIDTIVHHDGHISLLATNNTDFNKTLVSQIILRSDGSQKPGVFAYSAPSAPYAKQLWMHSIDKTVKVFNVDFDSDISPEGKADAFWFNRSNGELKEWNISTGVWDLSASTVSSRWVDLDPALIRNSLVLNIEQKLYSSVHSAQQLHVDLYSVADSAYAKLELARYSAKYNYDTFAPNYSSTDAFTWNYSQSGINAIAKARWFDVLKKHFTKPGIIATCRPDLEPWKLKGFNTMPSTWMQNYASNNSTRIWNDQMWIDIKDYFTSLGYNNLKLSVDTTTDLLLPPYVNAAMPGAINALTNAIFNGIELPYEFNQNGPVETLWTKSIEYLYGLARSYFRISPLRFLDLTWGETYVAAGNNLRVERNTQASLSPYKFLLHGEKLNVINNLSETEISNRFVMNSTSSITWEGKGTVEFIVSHCEFNDTTLTVLINGNVIGEIKEGQEFDLPLTDGIAFENITLDDLGIPFDLGERFVFTFSDNIVDPSFVFPEEIGCDGCISGQSTSFLIPTIPVDFKIAHYPALTKKFKGLGQVFTNFLRFNTIDTQLSEAVNAYNGWTVKLAHRLGALIRPDLLTINTALGKLPPTAYSVVLHKSSNTDSKWISALRIQLVQIGSKTINEYNSFIPATDASNWTFRLETYNPQHPEIEYYELDLMGDFQTFNILDRRSTQTSWKKFTGHKSIKTINTPLIITGLQNVLNIVHGYVDRLEDIGWKVNLENAPIADPETGRNLDWQLEVEKLVDRVYRGLEVGTGHVMNPFYQQTVMNTPIGLLSEYTSSRFTDVYSLQAAFDVTGSVIPVDNLNVMRTDDNAVTYSNTPIFSSHVFIDEFEHTILINKKMSEETSATTLFDPFLGIKIDTAYLSFKRHDELTRKPVFSGFFLSGNEVKRNVASSISSMANYYDSEKTFDEPASSQHALSLLGYSKKDYFSDLNITDSTQFNFWRGLIQAKGTNMTVDAFVNYKKFADASVDEYWAYKLADYGDSRERTYPEVKINPSDVTQKFARLQFYSSSDENHTALPLFTQIENSDDTRWFSLDDLGKGLVFESQEIFETVIVDSGVDFPHYVRLKNIMHNGDVGEPTISGPSGASFVGASLVKIMQPGTYVASGFTWLNPSKLSPIKLFDYKENTLVDEIGLWHPAIGIHAAAPLEVVNLILDSDPAYYNYTTLTTNNSNFKHLKPWGEKEVGKVWWNTENLSYTPYYDSSIFPSRDTRHSRWGSLAEWSSISLSEWTSSPVHPAKYNEYAEEQEGKSDIDKSIRASGKAANPNYYTRDRIISMRPIAWSEAGVGNSNAHPSFGSPVKTKVFAGGGKLIVDSGRLSESNLVNGRTFAGWLNNKPVGEVLINGDTEFFVGSSDNFTTPSLSPADGILNSVIISPLDKSLFGSRIGEIRILKKDEGSNVFKLRMIDSVGFYEDARVPDWYSVDLDSNNEISIDFEKFGLSLTIQRSAPSLTIYSEDLINSIVNPSNSIVIREAIAYDELIALPSLLFVNDETDTDYLISEYEWRTWTIPSQSDLDSDLLSPRNTWRPYLGDKIVVPATQTLIKMMKDADSILTLRSGISIERFSSTWTDWIILKDTRIETIANGIDNPTFILNEEVENNRLTIYINGIRLNPGNYSIESTLITITTPLKEGDSVYVLYRAFNPSQKELSFDPDVEDDVSIQTQFKLDYQYTILDIRNEEGNIVSQNYYFWVQDKTVPAVGKSMSLAQASQLLKNGPSSYTIFSAMKDVDGEKVFDSCAIAGLGALVGKNDSYKLRFLRDFTLRDDPEEMNLKNVHSEWALIRRQQKSKIPASLWELITDAACGETSVGGQLPSQVRIDYDLRNGTSTRFGFQPGQIFADTTLVRASIINTILNTTLNIKLGSKQITDYITALDFNKSDEWFKDAETARITMNTIWNSGRASQINEIFFEILNDALANNYEFSDIIKTSFITVSSTTQVKESTQWEQIDEQY